MVTYCVMLAFTMAFSLLADRTRIFYKSSNIETQKLKKIRLDWICVCLSLIPLILVSALRYDVGVDYFNYGNIFHLIREQNNRVHYEIGFYWINLLIGKLTDNPQWILIVCAVLTMFFVGWAVAKYSSNITLSLFLFVTLGFYFYSMNNPRYYIALTLSLIIGALAQNKKTLLAFVLIGVGAIFFHKSLLIMLPIILIAKIQFNIVGYIMLSVFTILVSLLRDPIRDILFSIYTWYQGSQYDDGKGSIFNILLSFGMLVWALIYYKYWYRKKDQFYFNLIWMASIFYLFYGSWIPESTRIGYYMSFSYILFIPKLISYEKRRYLRVFYTCGILGCGLVFCYMMLHKWQGPGDEYPFLPYQTVVDIPEWLIIAGIVLMALCAVIICILYRNEYKHVLKQEKIDCKVIEDEQVKVSVIIPVYKTEQYLSRCIESVMKQTYSNLEIILIDDGSPDRCPEMCDSFGARDQRIKVIHKQNGGLSDARNAGIEATTGDYLMFIDSDDYISVDMVRLLLHAACKEHAEVVACGYYITQENGQSSYFPKPKSYEAFTPERAIADAFSSPSYCEISACNKMFSARLFKDLDMRFPVGKLHEDTFMIYQILFHASKTVFIDKPLYYYVQTSNSIMRSEFDKRHLDVYEALEQAKEFAKKNALHIQMQLESYEALMDFYFLNLLLGQHTEDNTMLEYFQQKLQSRTGHLLLNRALPIKHKVGVILLHFGFYSSVWRSLCHMKTTLARVKQLIVNGIRQTKAFCFFTIPSYLLRICPIDQKKVLFISYVGKGFGDNGKYIAQALHEKAPDLKLVWITNETDSLPGYVIPVRRRSLKRLYHSSTAKFWIDNCRKNKYERKRGQQFYIQTWHGGIALKRVEKDAEAHLDADYVRSAQKDSAMVNLMVSNSRFCTDMYRRAFWYDGEIIECGSPRVDILFSCDSDQKKQIKEKLGFQSDDHIVLYAPTFRKDKGTECYRMDFKRILEALSRDGASWKFAVRLHPNIADQADFLQYDADIINATNYPDMYELMAVSDILITDYSSVMFEAGFVKKPVFLFATDIEDYKQDRNFYFDLEQLPFPLATTNKDLLKQIECFSQSEYEMSVEAFNQSLGLQETGHASEILAERILQVIGTDNEK